MEKIREQVEPTDFLYGFHEVLLRRKDAEIVEVASSVGWLSRWINRFFQKTLAQNFHLLSVFRDMGFRKRSICCFTNIDSIALPLSFLKLLGIHHFHLIHVSQGLTNVFEGSRARRIHASGVGLMKLLLSPIEDLVVLGEGAASSIQQYLGVRSRCVQYGVDTRYWSREDGTSKISEPYLLSVGSDANRDYDTLLSAVFPIKTKILTQLNLSSPRDQFERVECNNSLELRALYQCSSLIIVTLKNVSQPSGQSTALQAMAMGKCVILTDTKGLWDRKNLVHGENIWLIEKESVEVLEEAVDYLLKHSEVRERIGRAAKHTVEQFFTSEHMGQVLLERMANAEYAMQAKLI
ncbi:MAG: glycosyltransferase [Opitutales bacterium]|nr:glycosyltransferase [Opitutales bacterium]